MKHLPHAPEEGTPGRQIIDLILRHGPLTIAELIAHIGVTATAVRQQTDRLVSEGWLTRAQRRGGPGRPAHVLSISDETRRLFAQQSDELSALLVEQIVESHGPDTAQELLRAVGRRLASRSRAVVGDGATEQRMRRLAELMNRQGMLVDACCSEQGVKLNVYTCPYPELAGQHREICEMERETMSELVGHEVALSHCMQDGHRCCEFSVPAQRTGT